jgi:hypothetical protein
MLFAFSAKQARKALFLPVSKVRTNKFYIFRHMYLTGKKEEISCKLSFLLVSLLQDEI